MEEAAEEIGNLIKGVDEAGSKIESGEISAETLVNSTEEQMDKTISQITADDTQAFKESFDDTKEDLNKLKDPGNAKEVGKNWRNTVKGMWESAKGFAKFVGLEAGKGALFFVGMQAVQEIFNAANKKPGSSDDAKKAYKVSSQILEASSVLQQVSEAWQLWLANHFENMDTYGSITVEGTTIFRFQIVQNKVADMTTVQDKQVGPALTVATQQQTLASVQAVAAAYKAMLDKAYLISSDISTNEPLMVAAGLDDSKADLDKVKAFLDATN